ncbi:MAG: hypothetical protein PHV53_07250 [Fermentimonas sp.]|nr:hypothetical protein [Fermentimonas sp.]
MKLYRFLIMMIIASVALTGCKDNTSNQMSDEFKTDYDIEYGIRQVLQYDPMNISGINLANKVDFFKTLRFTLQYRGGKLSKVIYSNGDVPFSPFNFETESEFEAECELDYNAAPNELRIKGTDKVIAYYQNGEFTMPFQLDCSSINYKYTFTNILND